MDIRTVEVADILAARDARAERQKRILDQYALPIVSLTMNIAGPVKVNDAILYAFREGVRRVEAACGSAVHIKEEVTAFTGCEAVWAIELPPDDLKARMVGIEQRDALGRLFDLDVMDASGRKYVRDENSRRRCLICSQPAYVCARSRAHTVDQLFEKVHKIIHCFALGKAAERALLAEAECAPKPGLVDPEDAGAHEDMDIHTFRASAHALRPYFERCAQIGSGMRDASAAEIFPEIKREGVVAEDVMYRTTNGANTHKGAIFSIGLLCCAAGICGEGGTRCDILKKASELAEVSLQSLQCMEEKDAATGGERQYFAFGYTGARGQAAAGFPDAVEGALPVLERGDKNLNDAGLEALMRLMARIEDSNLLRRGGMEGLSYARDAARKCIETGCRKDDLRRMNEELKRRNLSPGGSADLLAVAYFLVFISDIYKGA